MPTQPSHPEAQAAPAELDLVPPSIPEGEYYESEITPADLPFLLNKLKQAQRLAKDRLKLLFLPNLPLVAGNIATQPFAEIWNGPKMRRFRQIISRRLFPGCVRCCSRSFP